MRSVLYHPLQRIYQQFNKRVKKRYNVKKKNLHWFQNKINVLHQTRVKWCCDSLFYEVKDLFFICIKVWSLQGLEWQWFNSFCRKDNWGLQWRASKDTLCQMLHCRRGNFHSRKYSMMHSCNVLAKINWGLNSRRCWPCCAHTHTVHIAMIISQIIFWQYESNHEYSKNFPSYGR